MAKKAEQLGLDGVPQPPKRVVIDSIEELCDEREKLSGKRTKLGQSFVEVNEKIQTELVEHDLMVYVWEDSNGVEREIYRDESVKVRKAKVKAEGKPERKSRAKKEAA